MFLFLLQVYKTGQKSMKVDLIYMNKCWEVDRHAVLVF